MAYIRKHYSVPAQRGGRVRFTGRLMTDEPLDGTIVGSAGQYLRVRFDNAPDLSRRWLVTLHPTWKVEYL